MIAANMFEQGLKTKAIAASLEADGQTVRRWRRAFAAGGRDALRATRHAGPSPLLTDDQRERLGHLLEREPGELGIDGHLWTTRRVADLAAREFGVRYHHDHVGVLLAKMGFTHQKPARRARERDEDAIEGWRREAWPALLKKAPTPAGSS